jgi:probable phosphoglycerate mutase
MNREAKVLPWLREFHAPINDPESGKERITWDWLPADWTKVNEFYDRKLWHTVPVMQSANVRKEADLVYSGLDELLEEHGYRHEGNLFRAIRPNNDTVILFCHLGVECVILGLELTRFIFHKCIFTPVVSIGSICRSFHIQ